MRLVKAQFRRVDPPPDKTEDWVQVQFNPNQLSLARSLQIGTPEGRRGALPRRQVTGIRVGDLTLELVFDTTDKGLAPRAVDVTQEQRGLKGLVDLVGVVKRPGRREPEPILVEFRWASFTYEGFIKNLEQRLTMFAPDGTPVRASVTVTMEAYTPRRRAVGQEARSSSQTSSWVVARGHTLSSIAAQAYGDPTQWRRIAVQNRLSDPLAIEPGQILVIPMLE